MFVLAALGCADEPAVNTRSERAEAPIAPSAQPPRPHAARQGEDQAQAERGAEAQPGEVDVPAVTATETRQAPPPASTTEPKNTAAAVATGNDLHVREYATPGGPAGVAPVPDYPSRTQDRPPAQASPAPSITVQQNNTTSITNNYLYPPYSYREPLDRRVRRPRGADPETPRRDLHPAVTTPVHPVVTTPVHP